jgi:hypothetical protein
MPEIHTQQTPAPLGPHPDSLADPLLTFESADRAALVAYCPRNRCGTVFERDTGMWTMYSPIRFDRFCEVLDEMEIELPCDENVLTWIDAVKATVASLHSAANDPE